jgi:selenocysteine-specific elongation factor
MPLIGTAGHVDHGKSTLIEALSGRHPDRWAEEKQRGLTIDLGFAWADLGDGGVVSFVDVPGHERFSKNMLAGVDALDAVLLVVAADEGWMPQTEEHMAVIDLLGLHRGVIALSKTDLVDEKRVMEVSAEVGRQVSGTTLEGHPIVPVSAFEPEDIHRLTDAVSSSIQGLREADQGRPRLWVDRSFSVAGTGTVATGSLIGGSLSQGEDVEIYPEGPRAKIRSVRVHEEEVELARPGFRTALGLAGVAKTDVPRGVMIGQPGAWVSSDRFVARIRLARYQEELPDRAAYQAHLGTSTVNARILRRTGDKVLFSLDRPVPMAVGDRLILRDTGPRRVVAGGVVVDPTPSKKSLIVELNALPPDEMATALLDVRGMTDAARLRSETRGGAPKNGSAIDDLYVADWMIEEVARQVAALVAEHHARHPLREGIRLAEVASSLGSPRTVIERAIETSTALVRRGADVALETHRPELLPEQHEKWDRARQMLGAGLAVPRTADLGVSEETIHLLVRRGELIRISEDFVMLVAQVDRVRSVVADLEPPIAVGDFKVALQLTRKHAMPLLEWLDSNEYTIRRADGRYPGPAL